MFEKGDFHMHTTASDGKLSPKELVSLAKKEDLDIIAITDHDNTFGIEDALNAGDKIGIKVITGIELSTRHNGESIHILGYFKDNSYKDIKFQGYLKDLHEYRIKRGEKIVFNLKKFFDIKLNFEEILKNANGIIARPHIAKAIIKAGYPYDFKYIFENFLNDKSPAYVPNKNIEIHEGLEILKSVNTITCLAHPTLIKNSPIENIIKYDFDCIEAVYPLNKPNEENKFRSLAREYNKTITAGSDYHGINKEDNKHGYIGECYLLKDEIKLFLDKLYS